MNTLIHTLVILCPVSLFLDFTINSFTQENMVDKNSEMILIEKTINDCIERAKTKDINLLYSIIAHDSSYLEVQPSKRIYKL